MTSDCRGYNLCDPDRLEDAGIHGFLRKEVLNMNKQNRFFRHKGLAGALAMVAVILAVAFAAGYHLPDAAAKKGKETAALTETQKQMPQKAPEPAISPEKAKEADRKESISLDASKSYHIIVEKKAHRLSLLLGDTVVRSYGCAIGKGGLGQKQRRGDNMTPVGTFTVDEIDDASSWPHDFGDGRGEIAGAYGPWFISLDTEALSGGAWDGIGIHGTHDPQSIGTDASEGCIRLHNEDLQELRSVVKVGTVVEIKD